MTNQETKNILDKLKIWAFPLAISINVYFFKSLVDRFDRIENSVNKVIILQEQVKNQSAEIEKIDKRVVKLENKTYKIYE